MKHAYLILAHSEFKLLQILVSCLDDFRNDIFVHIDYKVKVLPELRTEKSGLYLLENRLDVRWGDVSQIQAEYALFETALANGPYQYYHLLSGVDLPLKSQDYIHQFFNENIGKEFIGYTNETLPSTIERKVQRWHLFPRQFRNKSLVIRIPRATVLVFQELFGIERNKNVNFKKGSNWVSITEALVKYVVDNKAWALKVFRNTFCGDEFFIQTLCWNSIFRKNLYNEIDDGTGCMRAIGWRNGILIDWGPNDYDVLKESPALFARKFNSSDMKFINDVLKISCNAS